MEIMQDTDSEVAYCPYCKEEVKRSAVKCKHCGSSIGSKRPGHEGICPYCKEQIHVDAIKCKHCQSNLTDDAYAPCPCGQGTGRSLRLVGSPFSDVGPPDPFGPIDPFPSLCRWQVYAGYLRCLERGVLPPVLCQTLYELGLTTCKYAQPPIKF